MLAGLAAGAVPLAGAPLPLPAPALPPWPVPPVLGAPALPPAPAPPTAGAGGLIFDQWMDSSLTLAVVHSPYIGAGAVMQVLTATRTASSTERRISWCRGCTARERPLAASSK